MLVLSRARRYTLDVNVESAEDVVTHQQLLEVVKGIGYCGSSNIQTFVMNIWMGCYLEPLQYEVCH
jgi:hypothetical protein